MAKSKIDSWLASAKTEDIHVPVCLDRELLSELANSIEAYTAAKDARERKAAKFGDAGGLLQDEDDLEEALAAKLADLHERIEADKAEHVFRFRKMGYEDFRAIIESHPPTDEIKERNPYLDHDPNSAAPFLVAGSCYDPEMTAEQAVALREKLPEGEWAQLYDAAIRANRSGVVIPKSVSSIVAQLASERRSTTQPATASPSPSSGGE